MSDDSSKAITCEAEMLYPNIAPTRILYCNTLPNDAQGVMELLTARPSSNKRPELFIIDDYQEFSDTIDITATEIPKELTHDHLT